MDEVTFHMQGIGDRIARLLQIQEEAKVRVDTAKERVISRNEMLKSYGGLMTGPFPTWSPPPSPPKPRTVILKTVTVPNASMSPSTATATTSSSRSSTPPTTAKSAPALSTVISPRASSPKESTDQFTAGTESSTVDGDEYVDGDDSDTSNGDEDGAGGQEQMQQEIEMPKSHVHADVHADDSQVPTPPDKPQVVAPVANNIEESTGTIDTPEEVETAVSSAATTTDPVTADSTPDPVKQDEEEEEPPPSGTAVPVAVDEQPVEEDESDDSEEEDDDDDSESEEEEIVEGQPEQPALAAKKLPNETEEAADTSSDVLSAEEVRSQVLALLEKYDKGKVPFIDMVMQKFKGNEMILLQQMRQRYGGAATPVPAAATPAPAAPSPARAPVPRQRPMEDEHGDGSESESGSDSGSDGSDSNDSGSELEDQEDVQHMMSPPPGTPAAPRIESQPQHPRSVLPHGAIPGIPLTMKPSPLVSPSPKSPAAAFPSAMSGSSPMPAIPDNNQYEYYGAEHAGDDSSYASSYGSDNDRANVCSALEFYDIEEEGMKRLANKLLKKLNHDPWDEFKKYNDEDVFDFIKHHPETCSVKYDFESFSGYIFPLSMLCTLGATPKTIEAAYQAHKAAIDECDVWIGTPLHYACSYRAKSTVINCLLAKNPVMLQKTNQFGRTPLHMACLFKASPKTISILLSKYPRAAVMPEKDGYTPIHLACENGASGEVVRLLAMSNPETCLSVNHKGCTPLHLACAHNASKDVIRALLEADPDAALCHNSQGLGPLHVCVKNQADISVIKLLVDGEPECLELETAQGQTAYRMAKRSGATEAVLKLLQP